MPTTSNPDEIRALVTRIVDGILHDESSGEAPPEVTASTAVQAESGSVMRVAVGADHGGYALKERISFKLKEAGYEVHDCGTQSQESVDYPDFARAVAEQVASGECASGVVVDGAGIGSAMVANKVPGVRAALCYDLSTARNSREHNHANVLTLGAGLIGENLAWQIVQEWLATDWGPGRHARRVDKIREVERTYAKDS